jgi:hypothetical protein
VAHHNGAVAFISKGLVKLLGYVFGAEVSVLKIISFVAVSIAIVLAALMRIVGLVHPLERFGEITVASVGTVAKHGCAAEYDQESSDPHFQQYETIITDQRSRLAL